MNALEVLPLDGRIRAIERLLEWRICEPESPLNLALELLKAHFAPQLVVQYSHIVGDGQIFEFEQPNVQLPSTLTPAQKRSLRVLGSCPTVFEKRTNLWTHFRLPNTPEGVYALASE